jgi:hypothetical protein
MNISSPQEGHQVEEQVSVVNQVPVSVEPGRSRFMAGSLVKDLTSRSAIIWIWLLMGIVYSLVEPSDFFRAGTFQTIFDSQQTLVFMTLGLCARCASASTWTCRSAPCSGWRRR